MKSLVKIGIANVDTHVGNLRRNKDRVIKYAEELDRDHATIGVFSEQVFAGYPAEDIVQWGLFVENQIKRLDEFAKST